MVSSDSDLRTTIDTLPNWVLAGAPVAILGVVLALLFLTTPFGDPGAMADASTTEILWTITVISLFVGVVPVAIGMLWFPYIRRLQPRYLHAALALSAGVLAFVAVEMTEEAVDYAADAADPLVAGGIALVAGLVAFAVIWGVSTWSHGKLRHSENRGLGVAYLVAIGLGLHSVGEGVAIGGAFMVGEIELVFLLIVGFLIHNVTEGPTVVAAVARDQTAPPLRHFAALGLIAGGPLVLGGWLGVVAYSPMMAAALLAIGVGAIAQVVLEVVGLIRFETASILTRANTMGFVTGFALMFLLEEVFLATYLGL